MSVCANVSFLPLLRRKLEVFTSHKERLLREDVTWFWNKIIWASSRSLEGNVQNSRPVYCFLMEKHWTFLLRKMNAYIWGFVMILTQCHLSKFKIIGKKKFIIRVQSIIFFWEIWTLLHHIKIAFDLWVYHEFGSRSFGQVQGYWKK